MCWLYTVLSPVLLVATFQSHQIFLKKITCWAIKTQLNLKDNLLLVKISMDTLQEEMRVMRYSKSY